LKRGNISAHHFIDSGQRTQYALQPSLRRLVLIVKNSSSFRPVSELLVRWRGGDQAALDALLPLVYDELRRLASHYLKAERPDHTLQSTALVHEAYLRFAAQKSLQLQDRAHFFGIAAHLMREILVDHARSRRAAKRNFGYKITLDESVAASREQNLDLLTLDEALNQLTRRDPQQGRIVEMRFFGGLSIEETSQVLGVSPATVKRDWVTARAWLHREMEGTRPA
jgi:RNA polymerase sigma factor (TIGR02999 family)